MDLVELGFGGVILLIGLTIAGAIGVAGYRWASSPFEGREVCVYEKLGGNSGRGVCRVYLVNRKTQSVIIKSDSTFN